MKYLFTLALLTACDLAGPPAPGTTPTCIRICPQGQVSAIVDGACRCVPLPVAPPPPRQCPADPQWPC